MNKLPALPAKEIIRALQKADFVLVRQRGSHARFVHRNDPDRYATVALHGGDVPRRDLASILRQAKLPLKEFLKLLGK